MNKKIIELEKQIKLLKKEELKKEKLKVPKPKKKLILPFFKPKVSKIIEVQEKNKENEIILHKSPFYNVKKWKVTGYILYEITKNSKDFKLIAINNFSDIFKTKWGKAYMKYNMLGSMNRKPLLIIKNHLPLSLKIRKIESTLKDEKGKYYTNGEELCYNPEVFYNTFEYITFANLKIKGEKEQTSMGEFFAKNWWKILIILIIIGFFAFTKQGQELGQKILNDMIFRHYN